MKVGVNNITLNYEKKGIGKPVLFLHGNGEDLHIFDPLTDVLSNEYSTYSIDSRNHGESTLTEVYSYEVMADDIYYFIKELNLGEVSIVGFSDGAIIALLLAQKYPEFVNKMVLAGVNIKPEAFLSEILDELKVGYENTKDPLLYMMLTQPNISVSELKQIHTPSLVIYGENDIFTQESFIEISEALPNNKTIEMKGHSHDSYIVNENILSSTISDFLDQ